MLESPKNKWIALVLAVLLVGGIALAYRQTSKLPDYTEASLSDSPTGNTSIMTSKPAMIVHIAGAVYHPGVYEVSGNVRVMDILKLAGGPLPQADLDGVNLAAKVKDGQRIKVPEIKQSTKKTTQATSSQTKASPTLEPSAATTFPIHLGSATQEDLMSIPGIGSGLAERIISFRISNPWATLGLQKS